MNDLWLIDSKKENIRQVNSYFENIKFRKGKGQERENLKLILQRFEYYGQQCYPKLCFKDFVEKVEYVSGKRTIRHVLQDIRRGNIDQVDDEEEDVNQASEPVVDFGIDVNDEETNQQQQPQSPERQLSPKASPVKSAVMTDEMRDMIRRKREEALAKRQKKLDESIASQNLSFDDKETNIGEVAEGDNAQTKESADDSDKENIVENENKIDKENAGNIEDDDNLHLKDNDSNSNLKSNEGEQLKKIDEINDVGKQNMDELEEMEIEE